MINDPFNRYLKKNYSRIGINRFIIDTPRAWKATYHPRFKDIFNPEDFIKTWDDALFICSLPSDKLRTPIFPNKIYDYFSGYRFSMIPERTPNCKEMFLSNMFFVLCDIIPNIIIKSTPFSQDDFKIFKKNALTGSQNRTSASDTVKINKNTIGEIRSGFAEDGAIRQNNSITSTTDNNKTDGNTINITDSFLSPQDQGIKPTTENILGKGVEGITPNSDSKYTTNTGVLNNGNTEISHGETLSSNQDSEQTINVNNNFYNLSKNYDDIKNDETVGFDHIKRDNLKYDEEFNKPKVLNQLYTINSEMLFDNLMANLSHWILQVNIATNHNSSTFNNYPEYK